MRTLAAISVVVGGLLTLGGCAQPHPPHQERVPINQPELTMMPRDVALRLVQRYLRSADEQGFMAPKNSPYCTQGDVWTRYSEITLSDYGQQTRTLGLFVDGPCARGVTFHGLALQDAQELAGAMNVLGAAIPDLRVRPQP